MDPGLQVRPAGSISFSGVGSDRQRGARIGHSDGASVGGDVDGSRLAGSARRSGPRRIGEHREDAVDQDHLRFERGNLLGEFSVAGEQVGALCEHLLLRGLRGTHVVRPFR